MWNQKITSVGKKGEIQPPAGAFRVDLTGKTVMPALIDMHSHLGYTVVKTNETTKETYTRENLVDHLQRYAYYGIAATLSLGVDRENYPMTSEENLFSVPRSFSHQDAESPSPGWVRAPNIERMPLMA